MPDERVQNDEQANAQLQGVENIKENTLWEISHDNDDETCAYMHEEHNSASLTQNS